MEIGDYFTTEEIERYRELHRDETPGLDTGSSGFVRAWLLGRAKESLERGSFDTAKLMTDLEALL